MCALCSCVIRHVLSFFAHAASALHHLSLLFTSVSLVCTCLRVLVADGQHPVVFSEEYLDIQQESSQKSLQQESPCSPTILPFQFSKQTAAIRRFTPCCLSESDQHPQPGPLHKRALYSSPAAFLRSHRRVLQLHEFSTWDTTDIDLAFYKRWRRPGFFCSPTPQRKQSLFVGGSCPLVTVRHSRATAPKVSLRTDISSSSRQLAAWRTDTAYAGRSSPLSSPCGCIVTFIVQKDTERSCARQENKQSIATSYSVSPSVTPTCKHGVAADPCLESTAESLVALGRNKDAPAYSSRSLYNAVGSSSGVTRHAAALPPRTVKIPPRTPDCRLDIFLTKCIGLSRTLVSSHLIKGRNVWINGNLCFTPSRRLLPGDCVVCLLTSSWTDVEKGVAQQTKNAEVIGGNSKAGEHFSPSQRLTDPYAGYQSLRCDTSPDSSGEGEALSTQLTNSKTYTEGERAEKTTVVSPYTDGETHVIEERKYFARKGIISATPARTQHTPEAQTKAVHTGAASGRGELHKVDSGPSSYCSSLTRNVDAEEGNTHQEVAGLKQWRPVCLKPDERPVHILYEDDHILVLNKPANVLTHPPELNIRNIGRYNAAGSVVQRLLHYFYSSERNVPETFSTQPRSPVSATISEPVYPSMRARAGPDICWACNGKEPPVRAVERHSETDSEGAALFGRLIRVPTSVSRPSGIVHRLDFGTTGVLVVAKTFAAAANLREQWKRREVFKGYIGVCFPELRARLRIDAPITRHQVDRARMQAVDWSDPGNSANVEGENATGMRTTISNAKKATTIISPMGGNSTWGLVAAIALTGRTHQVRAHLEYAGHALVGDNVYGQAPKKRKKKRVTEAKQRGDASPYCDRQVRVQETVKLSTSPREETRSYRRISPQSCSRTGRASKIVESVWAAVSGEAAESAQCIRNTGGSTPLPARPLLHAYLLRLRHPVTGCYQEFRAPVPSDIERVAGQLNTDWRRQLRRILDDEVAVT